MFREPCLAQLPAGQKWSLQRSPAGSEDVRTLWRAKEDFVWAPRSRRKLDLGAGSKAPLVASDRDEAVPSEWAMGPCFRRRNV